MAGQPLICSGTAAIALNIEFEDDRVVHQPGSRGQRPRSYGKALGRLRATTLSTDEKVKWSDLGMDRRLEGRPKVWLGEDKKPPKRKKLTVRRISY